ncbi:hypothetical protein [Streptomyces lasiicapitis]|uniref:hypothetical protein n=1 Tax=Streptomyces lasiicapitis TaxID=1923961 RepID=UPI003682E335
METDGELGDLVELSLELFGGAGEVDSEVRQSVQEVGGLRGRARRLGILGRVQFREGIASCRSLGFQVVVRLPETSGEGVVGGALSCLAEDVVLAPHEVGEGALKTFPLRSPLLLCAHVRVAQVGDQKSAPLRTEDTVGEERADGHQKIGFVDVEGRGMPGVHVRTTTIVGPGPA